MDSEKNGMDGKSMTHGSSDSTSIGAVLYDNGPMKHALYIS